MGITISGSLQCVVQEPIDARIIYNDTVDNILSSPTGTRYNGLTCSVVSANGCKDYQFVGGWYNSNLQEYHPELAHYGEIDISGKPDASTIADTLGVDGYTYKDVTYYLTPIGAEGTIKTNDGFYKYVWDGQDWQEFKNGGADSGYYSVQIELPCFNDDNRLEGTSWKPTCSNNYNTDGLCACTRDDNNPGLVTCLIMHSLGSVKVNVDVYEVTANQNIDNSGSNDDMLYGKILTRTECVTLGTGRYGVRVLLTADETAAKTYNVVIQK